MRASASVIKGWATKDPVLSKVMRFILLGWPEQQQLEDDVKPYSYRKSEISIQDGCVLWDLVLQFCHKAGNWS